jgi:uncharacterized protein (DUF488 family)
MRILTIGHSVLPLDQFIKRLKEVGATLLVDVRSRPYSRYQEQFNREALRIGLENAGIQYRWEGKFLGGLGGTQITNPGFIASMERVLASTKHHVPALMCSEKDPKGCHRAMKLTAWLMRNSKAECFHILQTSPGLVEAGEFEKKQKPSWGWHELFPQGKYGAKP